MATDDTLREDLATCARILVMQGLIGLYGHVSALNPETDHVLLSPGAGIDKATTTPDQVIVMDRSGAVLEASVRIPIEWPIHTAIHAARSDALAIAHLHAPYSTLFAMAKREFQPVNIWGAIYGTGVPLYAGAKLITTPDLSDALAQTLGAHRAVLMRGHGSAVVGRSIEEVLYSSLVLEDNARGTWQAAALGEVDTFSKEECAAYMGERAINAASVWGYYRSVEARWDKQPGTSGNPLG